jgi:hypothetical protein
MISFCQLFWAFSCGQPSEEWKKEMVPDAALSTMIVVDSNTVFPPFIFSFFH